MRIVPATAERAAAFLARLGANRRARLDAMPLNGPGWLARLIEESDPTWCGLDEVGPAYVGGITIGGQHGAGYVWQHILPDVIARHGRAYLRQQAGIVRLARGRHTTLRTLIRADDRAELRHMQRQGAAIGPVQKLGGFRVRLCERSV